MEFMDRHGRMKLVQFWLLVNNIKDPLEDAESEPLPQHSTWSDNDVDDLSVILNNYFSDPMLEVDPSLKDDLASFIQAAPKATADQYQKARKAILIAQQAIYQTMEREHFPLFRKTDLWHKYLAATDSAPNTPARPLPPSKPKLGGVAMGRSQSTGHIPSRPLETVSRNESATDLQKLLHKPPATRIPSDGSHHSLDEVRSQGNNSPAPTNQQADEDVVDAISAALNDIIKSDAQDETASNHRRNSSNIMERQHPNSARSSIDSGRNDLNISDEGALSSDRADTNGTSDAPKARAPIFDDDDDYRPTVGVDILNRMTTADDEPLGPRVRLDVIEELEGIEVDTGRLKREVRLTTKMIGKAELTGSYEELRLLKDSLSSIERELARKEQFRDTYAARGGEHSLTVLLAPCGFDNRNE
jgi:sorting nexin-25